MSNTIYIQCTLSLTNIVYCYYLSTRPRHDIPLPRKPPPLQIPAAAAAADAARRSTRRLPIARHGDVVAAVLLQAGLQLVPGGADECHFA